MNKYRMALFDKLLPKAVKELNIEGLGSPKSKESVFIQLMQLATDDRYHEFNNIINVIQETAINCRIAAILCGNIAKEYGEERGELARTLFNTIVCKKNGKSLLVYDLGEENEYVIVKNKDKNAILFMTKLVYKDKDCNYYTEEDYIGMNNIHKHTSREKILNSLNIAAYEISDEFAELFMTKEEKEADKINPTHQTIKCAYGM